MVSKLYFDESKKIWLHELARKQLSSIILLIGLSLKATASLESLQNDPNVQRTFEAINKLHDKVTVKQYSLQHKVHVSSASTWYLMRRVVQILAAANVKCW